MTIYRRGAHDWIKNLHRFLAVHNAEALLPDKGLVNEGFKLQLKNGKDKLPLGIMYHSKL